jgi:hypothetical protein
MSRKPSACAESPGALADRRREERRPASGAGWMEPLDGGPRVWFRLMDVSGSGFRAQHYCAELRSGQKIRFSHALAKGLALVMWNRLAGGAVESGFLVVSKSL